MTAPITQDLLTIPRKLPETGLRNIVGLTRDELHDALIAAALTYWVVNVRRRWYAADLLAIEKEAR